jgi:hypothetical protein
LSTATWVVVPTPSFAGSDSCDAGGNQTPGCDRNDYDNGGGDDEGGPNDADRSGGSHEGSENGGGSNGGDDPGNPV